MNGMKCIQRIRVSLRDNVLPLVAQAVPFIRSASRKLCLLATETGLDDIVGTANG